MKLPEVKILKMLGIITLVNLAMLFIRNRIVDSSNYNFLLWNLFLGFIPLLVAYVMIWLDKKIKPFWFLVLNGLWLLFYPNSPYMMSDLMHVEAASSTVIYDTLIIFSISTLSLYYGFYSMKFVFDLWETRYSRRAALLVVIASLVVSSFGIYLGRILRLNSWNLFTHPFKVIAICWHHLWPVNANPVTYYIILLFSIIQFLILWLIYYFRKA